MRITDVEPIVLRLAQVDTTRADGTQDAFLVRIHTDEGIVGVGEADTAPTLARAIIEMPSSHAVAQGLREVLVGEDPLQIDRLWQRLFHASDHYGRRGAALHVISAIDIALWDIAGKVAGRPVCELLGGRRLDRIPVYASEVMPESPDLVRGIAEAAVEAGYSALKLGWGPLGRDLALDEELVARSPRDPWPRPSPDARRGPHLHGEERRASCCAGSKSTTSTGSRRRCSPTTSTDIARLADGADVRIAAGEADETFAPFRALVEHGHLDVLQPDIARCGGFTVARQIALLERSSAVEIVPHCFSTGVLVASSLQFVATLDRRPGRSTRSPTHRSSTAS